MLTDEKREELKELLSRVNVSKICKDLGVSRATLWRTLNGNGRKYSDLDKVIAEARKQEKKLQQL